MAIRDLKYSDLIVLTGAGASKPCGLPDMWEFAQKFRQHVEAVRPTPPAAQLVRAILSPDQPNTDLEGLMTALMSLSGEAADLAADLLLSQAATMQNDLIAAADATSTALGQWLTRVPFGEGPFEVVRSGALTGLFPLGTAALTGYPSEGSLIPPPRGLAPLATGIDETTVEKHRKAVRQAQAAIDDWRDRFTSIKPAAAQLLTILKAQIQNTYSAYSVDRAVRIYRRLFNELLARFPYLDIFTLNYDTVIERVLGVTGKQCFTGFTAAADRVWRNAFPNPTPPQGSVRLFKLHGSVNWFKLGTRAIEITIPGVTGLTTAEGEAPSMLIYPLTHKVAYDEPHLTLLHHFSRALKTAKRCLIIGCSLRDDLVSSALAFAARDRPDLRFILCGSESRISSNHWLRLFRKRFTVMDHRFGQKGFAAELKAVLTA